MIYHGLRSLSGASGQVNWAGFYVIDKENTNQLILGPFQGQVACQTIQLGRGVCGTTAASGRTSVIMDVDAHADHIACDSHTKSEIVVAIRDTDGRIVGVMDIDCASLDGFDEMDRSYLEQLANIIGRAARWD